MGIVLIVALVCCILSALGKCPLWVAVLLVILALLLPRWPF